ncbi:hypothetical protein RA19_21900 [Leisingera sp. ANG-M1]|uniref:pilus assembly protein TadG-related protein n=1 Tax=Leisingera sp. ANG-M1 TaxID=1577895 RepID=UPI0005804F3A|nr:pilus assembly protein TadG-related protein [Leisingera sp. ANG-M1]KIC07783.1 hypothetical protein RA19_21900 [Leisingera sp. ANG-M1]
MSTRHKNSTALSTPLLRRCLAKAKAYRSEEDGVLVKPMIGTFLAMLAIGGIGVDLMRMERDRTNLQYTLDRAVLAAADLDQQLDEKAVVLDYLAKAGLEEYYSDPVVTPGFASKAVDATINTSFNAHMLNFAGGGDMPMYARSRAEESIDGVEISLVLDVSGSMRNNNRLTNLKIAAKEFVKTMVDNTTDGRMSMSIVPYATQVSVPQELLDQYTLNRLHDYSNCVNFDASDFNSTSLSTDDTLTQTMHFSPWYYSDKRTGYYSSYFTPVCVDASDTTRQIKPFQKDLTTLQGIIDNLWAGGNTSIDIGMKWGTALLDPSARPAIAALSSGTGSTIPSVFSARPSAYTSTDTVKVIVLMTDGQNTSQYFINNQFREGESDVWFHNGHKVYSTYNPGNGKYRWKGYSGWKDNPYRGGESSRLQYTDLYAKTSTKYLGYYIYGEWMSNGYNAWHHGSYSYHGNSEKNARTRNICQAAKDQGIIVYTIGFEAPSNGVAVLQDCASSDSHYFDVDGLEIADAFASIATSIRQLRLTQ